jgi:hypothetical protein
MDMERFLAITEQLRSSGRLAEVLGEDGTVRPSEKLDKMRRDHPNPTTDEERAEAWREAQAQTLLDLAEKYQAELH